jgi:hypothetical protein
MTSPISSHFSFIVRCWRDANGILRGLVVDALTQRAYPFATEKEMTVRIESLSLPLPTDDIKGEENHTEGN